MLRAAQAAAPVAGGTPPATLCAARKRLGRLAIVIAGAAAIRHIITTHRALVKINKREVAEEPWNGLIFQVSLNRDSAAGARRSVGAIKADAARSLFSISCKDVGWAVLDSGIDQSHRAFWDYEEIWEAEEKAERMKKPPPGMTAMTSRGRTGSRRPTISAESARS